MAASDGNAFDKSTCRKTCTQNDEEEREGRTFFFSAKRGGECKTATTKADSKNYNATTKADSDTFTLPHFFLFLFAHNFLALFTHIQTGKQTDRQSDHQEFCRNKQIPSDCGGA